MIKNSLNLRKHTDEELNKLLEDIPLHQEALDDLYVKAVEEKSRRDSEKEMEKASKMFASL